MAMVGSAAKRLGPDIRLETDFDFLGAEYRAFFRGDRATVFQAPRWLYDVHHRLMPAIGARQHTITVRDRNGELRAVFPLAKQARSGVGMIQFADFGVCDYNAAVADRAVLEALTADDRARAQLQLLLAGADVVLLRKIRADGFDLARLFPRTTVSPAENAAYHLETGLDFEHWRKKVLRPKFTKELARLQRQTERDLGPYEHRLVTDAEEIGRLFGLLRAEHASRHADSLLNVPAYFDFYRAHAAAGAATGETLTYASYLDGVPVAVLFALAGDGACHAVLIGAETAAHPHRSLGIQLIYRVVEMRMHEGYSQFDMGIGDPGYKGHFRPVETKLSNITLSKTATGKAVAMIYHRYKPMKDRLKRIVDVR